MNIDSHTTNRLNRFLLPSITDVIFILLLAAFTYGVLAPRLLWDGDIGWHIRNGQNILASDAIPRADSFSATMPGQPWYSWEWLFDTLVAAVNDWVGLNGVVFAAGLVLALTLAIVFRVALRRGGTVAVTIVIFSVAVVACSIHFLARPHIVSWLFAVLWFWILDAYDRGQANACLWVLPVLMLLWVNLHGGFVLGFVLLGIFLVSSLLDFATRRDDKSGATSHARNIGLSILGCAFISLLNPYGYKLHIHVYRYLTNHFYMQHIDEFRAPNLRGLPSEFFVLLLAFTLGGMMAARFRLRWSEWLLIGFSASSGFWAARNIPIASLLLTMIAAPLFSRSGERPSAVFSRFRRFRFRELELSLQSHVWPVVFVLLTLLVCIRGGKLGGRVLTEAHFDANRFPVSAVNFLAERGDHEPIFGLDSWGGYLIYRRYPEQKVFVDDRHDFYGEAYLREYLKVLHLEPGWEQVLDGWGVHRIVFPAKSKLTDALPRAGWQMTYADRTAVIFSR